jgi:hypothetical protein
VSGEHLAAPRIALDLPDGVTDAGELEAELEAAVKPPRKAILDAYSRGTSFRDVIRALIVHTVFHVLRRMIA